MDSRDVRNTKKESSFMEAISVLSNAVQTILFWETIVATIIPWLLVNGCIDASFYIMYFSKHAINNDTVHIKTPMIHHFQ